MIIITAIDDRGGMMFNHRRQSQDRILREKILALTVDKRLWMNRYSEKQFKDCHSSHINVDDNFLTEAAPGEFCFVEDQAIAPHEKWIEQIILFKWNRKYPGDLYFDINLQGAGWALERTEEFAGSSHEKITMEVYGR